MTSYTYCQKQNSVERQVRTFKNAYRAAILDNEVEAVEAEDEVEHRVKDSVDEVEVARGEEMEKRVRGSVVEANGEEVETGKEDEVEDRKGEEEDGVQEDEATRAGEEEEGAEAECLSEASTSRS